MSIKKSLLILASATALHASAQTDTATLQEVVVTATKWNLKTSQTGKVISVIDKEMLSHQQGRSLAEVLNTQAGIFINGANNNAGSNWDIYFRGAGNGNVLILVDGIAVYDPSEINSNFDLSSIPLNQIEKIEILKGGQSTLWGSSAVAGIIHIITKKAESNKINTTVGLSYGSYNTKRFDAGVNAGFDRWAMNLQGSLVDAKGFSSAYDSAGNKNFDADGFKQYNVKGEVSYRFNAAFKSRVFASFDQYKTDVDNAAFSDDKDFTAKNKNFISGLNLSYLSKKADFNFIAALHNTERSYVNDSGDVSPAYFYSNSVYKGRTAQFDLNSNIRALKHLQFVAGAQYLQQRSDEHYLSIDPSVPAPWDKYESRISGDSSKSNQFSAYASMLLTDLGGWNAELGGRYNQHSVYGNNFTYTFNPSYVIDENTKVFLNISSGYKIPSLYQLYSAFGNRNLKPEESTTYELGVEASGNNKQFFVRIVAFKRDIKNMISFFTDPMGISYYINRDAQNDHGLEVEAKTKFEKAGYFTAAASYVNGKGNINNVKVNNLYRRPKATFSSSFVITALNKFVFIPSVNYVGERQKAPFDFGPATQPEYYTLNFYTSWQPTKNVKLFVDLKNITNQEYFDLVGYNTRKFNFVTGVNLNF